MTGKSFLPGITKTVRQAAALFTNTVPLYYWYMDAQLGDATGEGVDNVWFVVSPTGAAVKLPVDSPPANSPSNEKDDKDDDDD